jgi:beta-glucosidase
MNLRSHLLAPRALSAIILGLSLAPTSLAQSSAATAQVELGHRTAPLLTVDGLQFKDLDRNGQLDPYEDWRLSPEARTADLVQRMSLEELAGLMVHGTLPGFGPMAAIGTGNAYDLDAARRLIETNHVNSFITRLSAAPDAFAHQNNAVQEIAEASHWGIPVTISSDPRHHFQQVLGASSADRTFSSWPEPLGFAAVNDVALTRQFGDVVRQEYAAVGIRESLAPQADLTTEPRWARANGTFGEDAGIASRMVGAYVTGVQNGSSGLNRGSVLAVVKHWAGYGAVKDGWDAHNYYGRYATFPGHNFDQHLLPFMGAFQANVAAVMPTYPILQGVTIHGKPLEQVGAGFSHQLLTDLLRDKYGFKGVILSDWGITSDCNQRCRDGVPPGSEITVDDIGMPWGMEDATRLQRFAKSINAGVDQVGGTSDSHFIVDAVHSGLVTERRVRESANRILLQKFQLGLFEQPYVDESLASKTVGRPDFVAEGEAAQARAVVLLQNKSAPSATKPLLPVTARGTRVFLFGIAAAPAQAAGFTVVTDPAQADLAIIRAPAPFQSQHPGYFFGRQQHEGRLFFIDDDAAYAQLLKAGALVPTIFVTTLERPLILTNVVPHATALLGDFGISDEALLGLITGKSTPQGHLPFELPSSVEAVEKQKGDLPHDSAKPLFAFGFGMSYP